MSMPVRSQKRPISVKRDLSASKETYQCQKRPIRVKRDLSMSMPVRSHTSQGRVGMGAGLIKIQTDIEVVSIT